MALELEYQPSAGGGTCHPERELDGLGAGGGEPDLLGAGPTARTISSASSISISCLARESWPRLSEAATAVHHRRRAVAEDRGAHAEDVVDVVVAVRVGDVSAEAR